jgi:hypothetical protein
MKKQELISSILDLYDELDMNREPKVKTQFIEKEVNKELSKTDIFLINLGKESFFKKVIYSWRDIKCVRDDSGKIQCPSFDSWVRDAVNDDVVPMDMSVADVIEVLREKLVELYETNKEKAIRRLLDSEKENKESE